MALQPAQHEFEPGFGTQPPLAKGALPEVEIREREAKLRVAAARLLNSKLWRVLRAWWEYALMAASLAMHLAWWRSPLASLAYVVAANVSYFLCIVPDHDLFTTVVVNHAAATGCNAPKLVDGKMDWGETQVRETANFVNGRYLDAFCHLFGGINYQVEHHLFPSICHVHYPAIAPLVKRTCEEFGVPYYNCPSLREATREFLKTVEWAAEDPGARKPKAAAH